jgi:Flp pilus assembly protein TadG
MTRIRALLKGEHGQALLETAMTLPLLLIVSVGIFEFGRAYQTWQVLTNAAREGARLSVLPNVVAGSVQTRVRGYLSSGQLDTAAVAAATITVDPAATVDIGGGATASASLVTIGYPFQFIVLQPVARLLVSGSTLGAPMTITASAQMRNESQ